MQTSDVGSGFFTVQFETFWFENHFRSRSCGHEHCASTEQFSKFLPPMFSRVCHDTPEFAPKFQRSLPVSWQHGP